MVECICGWAFTRLLKGVSESGGLIPGWATGGVVYNTKDIYY